MAYIDPELDVLIARQKSYEMTKEGSAPIEEGKVFQISVMFKGDVEAIEKSGLKKTSASDDTAYGTADIKGLISLSEHPNVLRIEKFRRSNIHLNKSVPDIKATAVWTRAAENFSGYTGRDVIVGIIDTGIDYKHKAFRKADGSTRIWRIWDQTLHPPQGGEVSPGAVADAAIADVPTPLGYGVEYTADQINQNLTNPAPPLVIRHNDEEGHGTHVAGTAAGDGSQAGGCRGAFEYIGVAPEASIIVVKLWGLSEHDVTPPPGATDLLMDAIRYILNQAKIVGKPVVINMSLGRFTDAMDGNSAPCRNFNTVITNNSVGAALVLSAGNDAQRKFHSSFTVPASNVNGGIETLHFITDGGDKKKRTIKIAHAGVHIEVQLKSPMGAVAGTIPWVLPGGSSSSATANGVGIGSDVTILNGAGAITLTITPPTGSVSIGGRWELEFKNTTLVPVLADGFCLYGYNYDSPYFDDHDTVHSTLNEYATSREVISVGAYVVNGGLAGFSARGPTLTGAGNPKPDISAPGVDIKAPWSRGKEDKDYQCFRICCCDCCMGYATIEGTSMAAPHVTGAIALMLHKDPGLTHTQIKTFIKTYFRPANVDGYVASADDILGWGVGRLDVDGVMQHVNPVHPPVAAGGAVNFSALPPDPFDSLHERLLGTDRGPEVMELAKNYFDEVRMMINRNKRVATVWHRSQGPAWIRLGMRSLYDPELPIPEAVNGVTFKDGVRRLLAIVKRYGSDAMLHDLSRYESMLLRLSTGVVLSELVDRVGAPERVFSIHDETEVTLNV